MEEAVIDKHHSNPLKPVIMIVDDEESIFRSIRANLGKDFTCLHAPTARMSHSMMATEKVDLCVLDYKLPDADGLELLQNLKQNHAHIPVIMITAYPSWELSNRALSLDYGADYFLSKPFDPNEFKQKVVTCIQKGGIQLAHTILKHYRKKHHGRSLIHSKRKKREKRLAEIIRLIAMYPEKWTSGNLARKYKVSQRQIEMDIEELIERKMLVRTSKNHFLIPNNKKSPK